MSAEPTPAETAPELQTVPVSARDAGAPSGAEVVAHEHLDPLRLRSFIGLSLGLIGPRANLAVSGVLLTLLVTQRATGGLTLAQKASGAVAITFALTANRLVGWLAYPLLGRASDRTRVAAGRRVPYMVAGLVVMGAATYAYTLVGGYWPLVGLVILVKTSSVVFGLNNLAAIPETFGKSRSLRAIVLITVIGTVVSLAIKFTAIATWRTGRPETYAGPFRIAGLFMLGCALLVLLLVREAPAAAELVDADRRHSRPWRQEVAEILAVPNARVLLGGVFLFWSGISATGYLAIVYFQKIQHAGANIQTVAAWITGVPAIAVGIPIGLAISRSFPRRAVMVVTPILGSGLLVLQYYSTHFWQSVLLAVVGAPLFSAFGISGAAMGLQLLPRAGGFGELLGKLIAPFSASALVCSFLAAWAVDLTGNYRVIWVFPGVAYFALGLLMLGLRLPPHARRMPPVGALLERTTDAVFRQVLAKQEGGGLLGGVVTAQDADASSWFEVARTALGDPYADPAALPDAALRPDVAALPDPPPPPSPGSR